MGVNKESQPMLLVVPEEEEGGSKGTVSTFLQSRIHESFTRAADQLYAMGLLTTEERIAISGCIGDALEAFVNIAQEKVPTASEIEVPIEVAQEILRNAILHRRQGIGRIAQENELGVPYSSEYLDLPDRTQDHSTLRELLELALMDERSAVNSYDALLDVVYQMDIPPGEDGPNREAYEEVLSDERDHENVLLRMLGQPETEPGIAGPPRYQEAASRLPETEEELLEELSKLEHDQWVEWSKDIAKNEDISEERLNRWKTLWISYDKLPVGVKGDDREYAERALEVVKDSLPINTAGYRLATHAFDKCMECSKPPEYEVMWFEGKAHAWFCEAHLEKWLDEDRDRRNGSDIPWIKEIIEGKALKNPTENTNPNIMSRFVKKSSLPETEAEFFEELARVSKGEGFLFDPNSTENEGRWRLMDPRVFVQGSIRRWNIWKETKAPGIQFVMGQDTRDKQWKPQAIRFKKPDWDEKKAAKWWQENKDQFQKEWTQANWDEWMQKHPDEIVPDYAGETTQVAMRTGQLDIPRTLAVDLDGTILEYDGFKGVGVFGSPIDGAREALQRFKEDGWFIVIDTCRGEVPLVIEHLMLFDIPFDSVNQHPFQPSTANPGKPMAEYRIDDTAIHFDGDWVSVYNEVGKREQRRSLSAMKIVWQPPIEKKIALQELSDDLSDGEWLDVLSHTTDITGDLVVLSRKVGMDTYRMVRCGGEYRAFRNFDLIYRSGGLFNEQELRESFEEAIRSEDPETVDSILRELESCLLSKYRSHGFNNPEQWISIADTDIKGAHRIIYVEADLRSFTRYNEAPMDDPQSLLVLLKRVADGAFAYDPLKYILFDFLDPFGDRTQPTDYPDPARWGEPEELKKRVRDRRRQRDEGELVEKLDGMKAKRLLDILVKERLL